MYTLFILIIVLVVLLALGSLYSVFKQQVNFFITGLDAGFSLPDLILLWNTAQLCNLEQPTSLFYSMQSLTKCMAQISNQTSTDGSQKNQALMSKLFDYRTKIQNEADDKKGLSSTRALDVGQTLRIILPGKGVFSSEIVNNGNQLVINVPKQKNLIPFSGEEWVGKVISVYLWRKGDARYVFDTSVVQSGLYLGKSSLFLKHSVNLVRTQKRKSVRVKCEIYGMLYIIKTDKVDVNAIETQNGFRCLIEDISESGALIKIGGKGAQNVRIKLQYNINNKLILMVGVIRTVEYNQEKNQSLLHFECTNISTIMRNEVLKFVYNMLPENEKEVLEALEQTEADSSADESVKENAENKADATAAANASAAASAVPLTTDEALAAASNANVTSEGQSAQSAQTPQTAQTSQPSTPASSDTTSATTHETLTSESVPASDATTTNNKPEQNEDQINVF